MQEESQINLQKEIIPAFPEEVKSPEYQIPQKNNNLLIYIIFIILILGILGFLGWKYVFGEKLMSQFFPTPTPTIQVATPTITAYTNNKFGFSFNYPSSLKEVEENIGNDNLFRLLVRANKDVSIPVVNLIVSNSNNALNYVMHDKNSAKKITIGNNIWTEYEFIGGGALLLSTGSATPIKSLDLTIEKNGYFYALLNWNNADIHDELFQILSTFKFVEKSTDISVTPIATESGK